MRRAEQKDGRILSKQISLSETMADLADPAIILVATWLIPHADDQGRMIAHPRRLKAQVFPMVDLITADIVATALERMAAVGMIALYEAPDGTPLLQFLSWWKWNDGQRWVYASAYPPPPGWTDVVRNRTNPDSSDNGGQCPPPSASGRYGVGEKKEKEEGGMELEYGVGDGVGEGAGGASAGAAAVFRSYETEIGQIVTQSVGQDITDLLDSGVPSDWLIAAFEEAAAHNKRSWAYARAIVERWVREGRGNGRGKDPPLGASRLTAAQREALARRLAALEESDGA